MVKMTKNPLEYLWIVSTDDYNQLYYKIFSEEKKNEALLLGFFSSIIEFAKKIAHDDLENIEMKDSIIHYQFDEEFFVVLVADKDINIKKANNFISKILNSFRNQYQGLYKSDNKELFNRFDETVEILLNNSDII